MWEPERQNTLLEIEEEASSLLLRNVHDLAIVKHPKYHRFLLLLEQKCLTITCAIVPVLDCVMVPEFL
jgi:hypothetical protein